jgi:hypothetical protein
MTLRYAAMDSTAASAVLGQSFMSATATVSGLLPLLLLLLPLPLLQVVVRCCSTLLLPYSCLLLLRLQCHYWGKVVC